MASVFTRIIAGELPARFVYDDDRCVAFLTAAPLRPGHTLVVPREEVDHWLDLDTELAAHLMVVAQRVGRGVQSELTPVRVALLIAGLEVPHTHLHVVPIESMRDLDLARADHSPDLAAMDDVAERLRAAVARLD